MSSDPAGGGFQLLRFVPLVFVVVGIGLGVSGIRRYLAHRRFLARAVHVPGVVTGHDEVRVRSGDDGTTTYWHPVLRFTTTDGRLVDTRASAGRRLKRPPVGEHVEVLYDPLDPLRAGTGSAGALAALIPLFIGLVFVPLGLVVFAMFTLVGRLP